MKPKGHRGNCIFFKALSEGDIFSGNGSLRSSDQRLNTNRLETSTAMIHQSKSTENCFRLCHSTTNISKGKLLLNQLLSSRTNVSQNRENQSESISTSEVKPFLTVQDPLSPVKARGYRRRSELPVKHLKMLKKTKSLSNMKLCQEGLTKIKPIRFTGGKKLRRASGFQTSFSTEDVTQNNEEDFSIFIVSPSKTYMGGRKKSDLRKLKRSKTMVELTPLFKFLEGPGIL